MKGPVDCSKGLKLKKQKVIEIFTTLLNTEGVKFSLNSDNDYINIAIKQNKNVFITEEEVEEEAISRYRPINFLIEYLKLYKEAQDETSVEHSKMSAMHVEKFVLKGNKIKSIEEVTKILDEYF